MDSEDSNWLNNLPSCVSLSPDNFERAMEYLELNCLNKVPKLDELEAQPFVKQKMSGTAVSLLYDYWLEKRLRDRKKLMFNLKREDEKTQRTKKETKADDPYVVFRQCHEKMHTRKNRALDQENYMKMLKYRRRIVDCREERKMDIRIEQKKSNLLKRKLEEFKRQYESRHFGTDFLSVNVTSDNESEHEPEDENHKESYEGDADDYFAFQPQSDCSYFAVRINLHDKSLNHNNPRSF
jgi:hypothetical protein